MSEISAPAEAKPKKRKRIARTTNELTNKHVRAKPPKPPKITVVKEPASRYSLKVVSGPGIELLPPASLIPNKRNARKHGERQIALLAKTIKRLGLRVPIVIDEDANVLAGHARLMAANQLAMQVVPCVRHTDLTPAQKREFVIADNSIAALSSWDMDMLVGELRDLKMIDVPVLDLGLDDEILKAVNAEILDIPDLDATLETTAAATEEGSAPPEDYSVADEEHAIETGEELAAVAEADKPRYHQLPPESATRAIRANEERIPLAILLNRDEWDIWLTYRNEVRAKSDKQAFAILMRWREPDPLPPPKNEKTAQELVDDMEAAEANRK